ncbi:heavy-metal-associated domain-containing protein [Aerococcaceae bacterium DSM 111021]|nr:heavy-metal-associated domain-containing protein [Aerococcaceae bacterium DSM 111021]
MKKEQFKLAGMGCMNCSKTIQSTLSNLEGVNEANVDYENKVAHVDYDEHIVTKEMLQVAVSDAGYQLIIK